MTVETMDGKATSTAEHPPVIVVEQVQVSTLLPSTRRLSFFVGLELLSLPVFAVSRITPKLLNRFSDNSVETWHVGYGRNIRFCVNALR